MSRYKIKTDDILISCVGTFGKTLLVPNVFEEGIINPRLIKLTPNRNKINPQYLSQTFKSELLAEQFNALSRGGTMGVINLAILGQLIIPTPPVSEQNLIIDFIKNEQDRVDILLSKINQEITLLKEYKTALISEVVTGKVKVI